MRCPSCSRQMKKGYFHAASQPIQWIPEGTKPSILKTGVAEGAVVLCEGSYWKTYKADAYYCPTCQIVIAPVE